MKALNTHEAKTRLSAVLGEVERRGKCFVICRNGKPVAYLVPHRARGRSRPHPLLSQLDIRYDPTEPLGAEEWPEEQR
ncbi:MAG: type II toxin-antitoxin system Phd/YefM family antitoxin [Deltaproteobacteria bacterium]|nr:type II toxin-antitoxin system Phd/YefM family antitoxin [Deltaproteobacteria bacterium]